MNTFFGQMNRLKAAQATFRNKRCLALGLGVALLSLSMESAASAQTRKHSFPIRGGSQPFSITAGGDGNYWFTLENSSEVARITPRGEISYFVTPTSSNPLDITLGPDGNVWFGEGLTGKIASVTPDGVITEYQFSFFGFSVGITTGADGNIWFSDQTDHAVWRYNVSTGVFTEFLLPTSFSFPGEMTTGTDGNVWVTEQAVDKYARVTPDGVITEFTDLPRPGSITTGPDGNLWITSLFVAQVARVNPTTLATTIFPTPSPATFIRPGNNHNLLFTESSANKIASITTRGVVSESAEFMRSAPSGITAGPGHQVWFLGFGSNRVYETFVPR